jgi:hypothetical protein
VIACLTDRDTPSLTLSNTASGRTYSTSSPVACVQLHTAPPNRYTCAPAPHACLSTTVGSPPRPSANSTLPGMPNLSCSSLTEVVAGAALACTGCTVRRPALGRRAALVGLLAALRGVRVCRCGLCTVASQLIEAPAWAASCTKHCCWQFQALLTRMQAWPASSSAPACWGHPRERLIWRARRGACAGKGVAGAAAVLVQLRSRQDCTCCGNWQHTRASHTASVTLDTLVFNALDQPPAPVKPPPTPESSLPWCQNIAPPAQHHPSTPTHQYAGAAKLAGVHRCVAAGVSLRMQWDRATAHIAWRGGRDAPHACAWWLASAHAAQPQRDRQPVVAALAARVVGCLLARQLCQQLNCISQ